MMWLALFVLIVRILIVSTLLYDTIDDSMTFCVFRLRLYDSKTRFYKSPQMAEALNNHFVIEMWNYCDSIKHVVAANVVERGRGDGLWLAVLCRVAPRPLTHLDRMADGIFFAIRGHYICKRLPLDVYYTMKSNWMETECANGKCSAFWTSKKNELVCVSLIMANPINNLCFVENGWIWHSDIL